MTPIRRARSAIAALLCIAAQIASAQVVLTPARYFECQIAARQATVAGLEERQALLSKGNFTSAEQQAANERSRTRVSQAFGACGSSVGALGAYAHRNAEELQSWLSANPQVKARLDAAGERVASMSAQMSATAKR